jgi:multidrug transporter EmrE-like cation transporter
MYVASVLAILASTALTVGLYFLKREAERLPSLDGGWRLSAWRAFFSDPWWLLGVALQVGGYGLYLSALRNAPLSVVHTALNGGIAFFVVLSVVGLGEHVRPIEWLGVLIVTAGLVALSVSLSSVPTGRSVAHGVMPFSVAIVAVSTLGLIVDPTPRRAIGLSVASGLIFGLASVYAKALANADTLAAAVSSMNLVLTLVTNIVGFALMQAALQSGRGVVVVPIFSTLSNLVPIVGGIALYGEGLPDHGASAVLFPLAFVLAIVGAALLAAVGEVDATPLRDGVSQVHEASWR